MNQLTKALSSLNGSKTYLSAIAMIAYVLADWHYTGEFKAEMFFAALGLIGIRSAVKKIE